MRAYFFIPSLTRNEQHCALALSLSCCQPEPGHLPRGARHLAGIYYYLLLRCRSVPQSASEHFPRSLAIGMGQLVSSLEARRRQRRQRGPTMGEITGHRVARAGEYEQRADSSLHPTALPPPRRMQFGGRPLALPHCTNLLP